MTMTTKTKAAKKPSKAVLTTSDDGTVLLTFRQRESGIKPWRKRQIVCTSIEDATRAYQEARDLSGLGVSCFAEGVLSTGHKVSYNGRVWYGKNLVLEADGKQPTEEALDLVPTMNPERKDCVTEADGRAPLKPDRIPDADLVLPGDPTVAAVDEAPARQPKKRSNNQEKVRAAVARPKAAKVVKAPKDGPKVVHARTSLAGVADAYVAHLTATKSSTTASSYRGDLAFAQRHLGSDTLCADLTVRKLNAYFASDAVRKTRDGKDKSPISIAKTCRVLRLALDWAAEAGIIKAVELPTPKAPAQ